MTFVFSIACAVAAVQILLSLALVFHKHNVLAIVSELATSTGLTLFISRYLLAWPLPYIILLGAAEYITVKIIILLVIVILKLRCFTILTILTHPSNRRYSVYKKRYSGHMHFISMVLQLVDRKVHANTPNIGGYSIWGADN